MQTTQQPAGVTTPEQSEVYKKGFEDGYALGAKPLYNPKLLTNLNAEYVRGDDAFQAYYSMNG